MQGRKTVSILFCDVVDSTPLGEQLDPESLQRVMSRWFAEARVIVERHGGTVEKFIGDEVMAVFGVPVVHEDDALRAVRAASAMRDRLDALNDEFDEAYGVRLAVRIGVNTGEVVVGDPSTGGTFITGAPVNLAKRLEQAADPGQILIGKATYPLVANAVRAGPLESFRVKGKREAVAPFRVEHVDAGAPGVARRHDTPLVDRTLELAQLERAFDAAAAGRTSRLVTVVAAAGLGKTRLTEELVHHVADRARVLTGRCLPYGDGITFWPLIEVLRSLGDHGLRAALAGTEDGDAVEERLRALTSDAPGPVDELFWAARRLLESLAGDVPVVLVLEDIDRAEPTFLDLVEYLLSRIEGAPVLLVCPARPELLERRPEWTAPRERAEVIVLEPLSASDAETLLAGLGADLDDATRERVLRSAEGNPLYVEQLAALAGSGEVVVPPTIQALLSERIDRLQEDERAILERAAVVGQEFSRRIVTDLCPPELRGDVGRHLLALVRKELIRPHASPSSREDSFRFRHALIRDVTYEAMPKEARALFHEWCADWIERNGGDRALELEEIAGYHLEQSVGLRAELGPRDARSERLAGRAAALLGAAGVRAQARGDIPAAIGLLERTAALLDSDDPGRVAVAVELGTALHAGGQFDRADLVLTEAEVAAARLGDDRLLAHAELEHAFVRMYSEPERALPLLEGVAQTAVDVFTRFDDDAGLARAWRVVAGGQFGRGHFADATVTLDRAIAHANRAGVEREQVVLLWRLGIALALGPVAADAALARVEDILPRMGHNMVGEGVTRALIARLHAMLGHDAQAREEYARARFAVERLGDSVYAAALALYAGPVEQYAGDLAGAERELRAAVERLGAMGEKGAFSTVAVLLARVRLELGDVDEASALVEASEHAAAAEDVYSRTLSRGARARILAVRGDPAAVTLARETVALAHETDGLSLQGTALLDLALVLDGEGADEALGAACERFAAKRDLASLAHARLDSRTTKA
ncbi:MAG TPA: adenylate/guanylate cyclase domain-containing protein [Gaiellaceae bacterium]|nr:adenylate/guanylate cyclase domain-containing protein [Gaiellaceae bacterium]